MSQHKPQRATLPNSDPSDSEQNILGPIMYDPSTSYIRTQSQDVTQKQRRAPKVGLKGSRSKQYTWAEKLNARIISRPDIGCWEVTGHQLPNGYVQISQGSIGSPSHAVKSAHRLAYELAHGPIPDGCVVAHRCDNPRCVRPDHLVATTQAENVRDSLRKGRYNAFGRQKLNAEQVIAIRAAVADGESQGAVATRFGIARNTVSQIANHKTWAHLVTLVDGPQPARGPVRQPRIEPVFERVRHVLLPVRGEVA